MNAYKAHYNLSIRTAITNKATTLFTDFTMQMVHEFIYLHEIRYPERGRAFNYFFREVEDQFLDDMLKLKCMTYMLDDNVTRRMIELMRDSVEMHIEMFMNTNPTGGANAYFTRTSTRKAKIMYYDVGGRGILIPPYKTFFHEFGHTIDNLADNGTDYYSIKFVSTQTVLEKKLEFDSNIPNYYVETLQQTYTKTIHEWAELDLGNYLVQLVFDCMQGTKGTQGVNWAKWEKWANWTNAPIVNMRSQFKNRSLQIQYDIAIIVIKDFFLFWDGITKLKNSSTLVYSSEILYLYGEVSDAAKLVVGSYDIFGGLTGNQIGSGHSLNYWFDQNGQRTTDISIEAFGGFFEYMVLHPDLSAREHYFDPTSSMPYTIQAMKEMFNLVV